MRSKTTVLGVEMETFSTNEVMAKTREFLIQQGARVIYLVDAHSCMLADEDTVFAQLLDSTDITIPADRLMKKFLEKLGIGGHGEETFSTSAYLKALFQDAQQEGREVCILMNRKEEVERLLEDIRREMPYFAMKGIAIDEVGGEDYDLVVNEVNTVAPDILLIATDNDTQRNLMLQSYSKMNAKLCICVGTALTRFMFRKRNKLQNITMGMALKKRVRKSKK